MNDFLKATGKLTITLLDENGITKENININNIVVLTGKEWITSRMFSGSSTLMSHMALGLSNNNLSEANIKLESETARVVVTSSINSNTITYNSTFGPGVGIGNLVEAGIFNSGTSNSGTMLARTIFTAINKLAADTLLVEWKITIN